MENSSTYVSNRQGATPNNDKRTYWRWLGWEDYRLGHGYRADYDKNNLLVEDKVHFQWSYEQGRANAASLKGDWGVVPEWPKHLALGAFLMIEVNDKDSVMAVVTENKYQIDQKERRAA